MNKPINLTRRAMLAKLYSWPLVIFCSYLKHSVMYEVKESVDSPRNQTPVTNLAGKYCTTFIPYFPLGGPPITKSYLEVNSSYLEAMILYISGRLSRLSDF